jgi:hypothetical protein
MIHIHAPSKHPSSMQTVEVFAKPGCSREPRKIPNENPFSAEFRGMYHCPFQHFIYSSYSLFFLRLVKTT